MFRGEGRTSQPHKYRHLGGLIMRNESRASISSHQGRNNPRTIGSSTMGRNSPRVALEFIEDEEDDDAEDEE